VAAESAVRLSVIFSFKDEEDVLPELIARVRAVLNEERERGHISSHELIFVNDGSSDRSEAVITTHAEGHSDIRLINMSRTFGVSPCVLAGMHFATGDLVVYLDADLQDPPEVISQMLEVWRSAPDIEVVNAQRVHRSGESRIKLFVTGIGYRILGAISSVPIQPEVGDCKLLTRRAVNHLIELDEKLPFMRGLVSWIGFRQEVVRYQRQARARGKTKFPVFGSKVIRNFLDSAMISFSDVPLKIALPFAALTFVLASLYLVWIVIEKFRGRTVEGYASMMCVILFLGSFQFLLLGIMGLYVNSIFLETKRRPNYIVRSTVGMAAAEERPQVASGTRPK
jgi:dolichol-phosphate mannosyltransferase